MTEYRSGSRDFTPAQEFYSVVICYLFKELLCTVAVKLILREEEHSHAEVAVLAEVSPELLTFFYKEAVRHLYKYSNTVACLALGVLAGTVLQLFNDSESIFHNIP